MHFLLRFFFLFFCFLDIFYFAFRCRAGAFLLTILCKITWMCASSCQRFRHDEAFVYSCETIVKVLRTSNIVCFYLFLKGTVVVLLYSYFSIKFWLLLCSVAFSAYSVSVAYTYFFFYIYINIIVPSLHHCPCFVAEFLCCVIYWQRTYMQCLPLLYFFNHSVKFIYLLLCSAVLLMLAWGESTWSPH